MTQVWGSLPHFKIVSGANTFEDEEAVSIQVTRPENNIAFAVVTLNDYPSKNYVDNFDIFNNLVISFKYGSDSYTDVFRGITSSVKPRLSSQGEYLDVSAWGYGLGLLRTHCHKSYGEESENATVDPQPMDILKDIITNYVNDPFDTGGNTQWGLTNTKIEDIYNAMTLTHINPQYMDNFKLFNRIVSITDAYAGTLAEPRTDPGVHWFIDATSSHNVYCKEIDQNHSDNLWDRYWGGTEGTSPGTQASSTIEVTKDMIVYDFSKNIEEYANKIILSCAFRKPGADYWTEDADTNGLWDETDANLTIADDAVNYIVGADSLKFTATANKNTYGFFPSAAAGGAANWDFSNIGSSRTPMYLAFYVRRTANAHHACTIQLRTTDATNYFFWTIYNTAGTTTLVPTALKWHLIKLPLKESGDSDSWGEFGAPDWSNVDFIVVNLNNAGHAGTTDLWIDDLHFTGNIIREAYDSTEITATQKEHQRFIRLDTAIDDTMSTSAVGSNTGAAARIAYSELSRRVKTRENVVGVIRIPGAPTLLPGQTVYIKAAKQAGGAGYRILTDMRVKELRHDLNSNGFTTTLNLTSDVLSSHAIGVPSQYALLKQYAGALGHAEAADLKFGGIDTLIPRLSVDYNIL